MTLRVGIISANWGAFAHLPAWRSIPGVEVVAICTSRRETAEAAAEKYQIERAFWNAEVMAADPHIDIIDCGTRPNIRQGMVLACLRNGKHVYNGIPFAKDLESARELHQAWRGSGTVGVVDAYSQWLPAHAIARDMIDANALGQPFAGSCIFNMPLFNQPNPHFPYNWFAQEGLGVSAMRNLGSHALHALLFLFGNIDELVAHEEQLLKEWKFPDGQVIKPETNDFANVLLRFSSGLTMQLQISWSATVGQGWSVDAFGSRGRLALRAPSFPTCRDTTLHAGSLGDNTLQQVEIPESLQHSTAVTINADSQPPPAYPMALSMNNMVRAIRNESQSQPDFEQAWSVERVQEAVRRSTRERRWVKIAEIV